MHLSDEEFREEFKPLFIPAHFEEADTLEQQITYVLAQLGEGSLTEVYKKLEQLNESVSEEKVAAILSYLYEKGRIKGNDMGGTMRYNLSKITEANDGAVNPGLLAPGLD